ncbi:MAG: hypothetical protein RLZZ516_2649 [Cyanobacteriota bacterium]|jgi:hypothetical protein
MNTRNKSGNTMQGALARAATYRVGLLIAVGIVLSMTIFPQYCPTTADDYRGLMESIAPRWIHQNRPWWLFTAPISEGITRLLFTARYVYGVHILAFYSQAFVIYWFMRRIGLRTEATLGFLGLLAVKVIGFDHSSPLSYPIAFPVALALTTLTGILSGIEIAKKGTSRHHFAKLTGLLTVGCLSSLWYEYYPLVFATSGAWGFLSDQEKPNLRGEPAPESTGIQKLKPALLGAPMVLMISLWLVGFIFFRNTPGFSSYDGNKINPSEVGVTYLLTAAKIIVQQLMGSTVFTHGYLLQSWPRMTSQLPFSWYQLVYCAAISLGGYYSVYRMASPAPTLSAAAKKTQLKSLSIYCLAAMTLSQLALHSLSGKYQGWFGAADILSGDTFLNSSMAIISACFAASTLTTQVLRRIADTKSRMQIASLTTAIFLAISALHTAKHNQQIAAMLQNRSRAFERIATVCNNPEPLLSNSKLKEITMQIAKEEQTNGHDSLVNLAISPASYSVCLDSQKNKRVFKAWIKQET